LPREMLPDLKAAWQRGLHLRQAGSGITSSSPSSSSSGASVRAPGPSVPISTCAQQVANVLRELGVAYDVGRVTGDGLVGLDIVMLAGGTRRVVLQLAKDTEFAANTRQLLGPALWQRDVIERNTHSNIAGVHQRYEVRLLPVKEWRECPGDKRLQFVAELLRQLGINVGRVAVERAAARQAAPLVEGVGHAEPAIPRQRPVRTGLKASEFDMLMEVRSPAAAHKQGNRRRRR
jgi:hypothetical protein